VTGTTKWQSLWQHDQAALRAERTFGYAVAVSGSVQSLSGVNY
jgi:hypothetical protein